MAFSIKLFGGLVVTDETGHFIRLPTRKSEALFAYLVEHRNQSLSRETLADLLWPYSGPDQARASLRQEVSVLRKALGPANADSIVSHGDRIEFSQDEANVDLWNFTEIGVGGLSVTKQKELLSLYTAPFLDTFRIRSQPFSDWVWVTRQAQEATALRFGDAAMRQWSDDDYEDNITEIAQHLCRIDPTYEPAHRGLVEYYVKQGDFHLAKHQVRLCETALRTHLDTEPSIETKQLAATLERRSAEAVGKAVREPSQKVQTLPEQQRRFVYILSLLSDNLNEDPEEFERIEQEFALLTEQVVQARGGIQLHLGNDRIFACFGYPTTHDRMADAAVGAAFEVLAALEKRNHKAALCQIGISAGLALVSVEGKVGTVDVKVTGAVMREAEELARAAPLGAIFVDGGVQSTLSPSVELKEVSDLLNAKQAIPNHSSNGAHSYDLLRKQSHSMVGREAPLAFVLALLNQTKAAVGSAVAIVGTPGAGKSRLVEEVSEVARSQGFDIKYFQGNLNEHKSILSPVIDHMSRLGAFNNAYTETPLQSLERWLSGVSPDLAGATEYFASLISNTDEASVGGETIAKAMKEKALDFFVAQAGHATLQQPMLIVFEDTHWFDPTTCEAMGRLIEVLSGAPVCVLFVAREGEVPTVMGHPLVQHILLSPLDPQNAEILLRGLLKGTSVSDATLSNILERAEGNPLFLEEFAKALEVGVKRGESVESGVSAASSTDSEKVIATPDRLLPLLLSRIDHVPGAIQVLQHASVFGRRFSLTHLSTILLPIHIRPPLLRELEAAGIIFATHRGPETTYIFKHALINEAIYTTIPVRSRVALHKAAALALVSDETQINDSRIARHFKAADDYEDARHFFELAGDHAVRVAAHAEAIFEYTEALAMVGHLPLSQGRMRKELFLNRKIAAQIIGKHGIPTSEAAPFYIIAQNLSRELGDQEEIANAAWGLWTIHLIVADLDACLNIVCTVKQDLGDLASPVAQLIVAFMFGVTHAYRGSLGQASKYLEGICSYDTTSMTDELHSRFGMDIGLAADSFLSWIYALQGETECAAEASHRALSRAELNNNGLSHVFAHVGSATKCLFLGQLEEARQLAEIGLKGAQEMQFKHWIAQSKLQLARVADLTGDPSALDALQEALLEYRQTGLALARPYAQVWIAEAMIRRGQFRAALQELDDLRSFTSSSKEQYLDVMAYKARELALKKLEDDAIMVPSR